MIGSVMNVMISYDNEVVPGECVGTAGADDCFLLASLRHLSLQYFTAAHVASSDHFARRFIGLLHCIHIYRLFGGSAAIVNWLNMTCHELFNAPH